MASANMYKEPASSDTHPVNLFDRDAVSRSRENDVGTSEGLGTSLERRDPGAGRHTLAAGEVLEEEVEIAVEVAVGARRNKGVHLDAAVEPVEHLVAGAADGDSGNGTASGGNWASAAVGGEPDHDLVGVLAARGGGEPEVVGNVGDRCAVAGLPGGHVRCTALYRLRVWYLRPLPDRRNGGNSGQLLVDLLESYVGVALDLVWATGPSPVRGPSNGAAAEGLEVGALRSRGGARRSPVVTVCISLTS